MDDEPCSPAPTTTTTTTTIPQPFKPSHHHHHHHHPRQIAEGFVANGSTVYISSRDKATLDATAEELTASAAAAAAATGGGPAGRCVAIEGNLGSRAGCEALAAAVEEAEPGGLHVLVNNSGASWGESIERKSGKLNWGWDKVLDLNVKAPFYLTRALLPSLRRAATPDDPGRVVMIGSVVGVTPQDFPTHAYDASKAALHSLTRKLAFELGPPAGGDGGGGEGRITVNAIAPGYVPTRMSSGLAAWGADEATTSDASPLGRMGQSSDMAGAAIFLASPAGSWVTGVILPVDGGVLSQPIQIGGGSGE